MYMTGWWWCEEKIVSGLMGRVQVDCARTSTSTWTDGPDSIRQREEEYWCTDWWAEFDWAALLRIPVIGRWAGFDLTIRTCDWPWVEFDWSHREASMIYSICQLEVHRCLTTRRVCFVTPRCVDDGRGSSSGGNTDASVRSRFVSTDVLIMNSASSIRELRCVDDEQSCSIRELECSVAAVCKILWIIADSVDMLADLWQLSTFVREILWIMDYWHLCAIFFGLSSILCCGNVSCLWQSLTIVFDISMDYYRDVGCNMELTIPSDFADYSEHLWWSIYDSSVTVLMCSIMDYLAVLWRRVTLR
jgi:hypothetical protein